MTFAGSTLAWISALVMTLGKPQLSDAQSPNRSGIAGVVRSSLGAPIRDALVMVVGGDSTRTNDQGYFRLAWPTGTRALGVLGVRRIGFVPLAEILRFGAGVPRLDSLDIVLDPIAMKLDSVRVTARADAAWRRELRRADWVRQAGTWDHVFLAEDFTRLASIWPSDVFRALPGFRVIGDGFGARVISSRGNCRPSVVLDGMPLRNFSVNEVTALDIKAMFVARGLSSSGGWIASGTGQQGCAVIAILTK